MSLNEVLSAIDSEIARVQEAAHCSPVLEQENAARNLRPNE